jgi:hypothetical protein
LKSVSNSAEEQPIARSGQARSAAIYAVSLALVVIVFILRSLLAPTLGGQALYLFLVPPVLVAGVLGGIGPGLLTTALCLIFHLYVSGEFSSLIYMDSPFFAAELWRAATFTGLGVGIAWFGSRCSGRVARRPAAKPICSQFWTPCRRR